MKEKITLSEIKNFETYWSHKPMNEVRIQEGFPQTTSEEVKVFKKTDERNKDAIKKQLGGDGT